ncbi:hypothetical protein BT69DRAFT_1398484, partial [Atractiella rhizophila]
EDLEQIPDPPHPPRRTGNLTITISRPIRALEGAEFTFGRVSMKSSDLMLLLLCFAELSVDAQSSAVSVMSVSSSRAGSVRRSVRKGKRAENLHGKVSSYAVLSNDSIVPISVEQSTEDVIMTLNESNPMIQRQEDQIASAPVAELPFHLQEKELAAHCVASTVSMFPQPLEERTPVADISTFASSPLEPTELENHRLLNNNQRLSRQVEELTNLVRGLLLQQQEQLRHRQENNANP